MQPHPNDPHEFFTACLKCGERAMLNLSLITDREAVKIITICTCSAQLQPHDRIQGVCPAEPVYGMPAPEWKAYGR